MNIDLRAKLMVTAPDQPVHAGISTIGIPYIDFHEPSSSAKFTVQLAVLGLTASEQAAWLRKLGEEAWALAVMVERRAAATTPEPETGTFSASTYRCEKCAAQFGIAGESTGSADDLAVGEYFDAEVAHHESGECVPEAAVAP